MEVKFAFTAQCWGNGAVVCRAMEDRPGPVVEQQFGEFRTWTQAHNFASKLNEGLDLDPHEVRRIVTSSFLATACVIQEALNSKQLWIGYGAERQVREAQLRFLISELAFALALWRTTALLSARASLCTFTYARKALRHTKQFLLSFHGNHAELVGVIQHAEALQEALQSPPPPCFEIKAVQHSVGSGREDQGWPLPPALSFPIDAAPSNAAPNDTVNSLH